MTGDTTCATTTTTTTTIVGSLVDAVLYCQSVNESSTVMLYNMKWQLFCLNLYQVSNIVCYMCASYYSMTVVIITELL